MEIPLLVISFFALGVIYSILLLINFMRFFRFKYFARESWIAKKFYICLFIIALVRASSFITACLLYKVGITEEQMKGVHGAITGSAIVDEIEFFPKPLFLFMIMPDFLVIIAFLILFWQLLALYNQGHANLFKVICTGKGKYIVLLIIITLSILQITMLGLYSGSQASAKAFSIECTVLNFLAATLVWVVLLVYALMFSGSPYRSLAYKIKMKKLTFAVVMWCVTRYFRGITGAFEQRCYSFVLQSMMNSKNDILAIPILCIIFFLFEEIIPMLIVLDWSFMEIFVISGDGVFLRNQAITGIYDVMKSYDFQEQQSSQNNPMNYVALQDFSSQLSKSSPDVGRQGAMKMIFQKFKNKGIIAAHGFDSKNDSISSFKNSRMTAAKQTNKDMAYTIGQSIGQQLMNQSFKKKNSGFQTPQVIELSQSNQLIQLNESQELVEQEEAFHLLVEKRNFQIIKIFDQKVNGIGTLHEAKLNDNIVICREIQFKRIKEYVIEDFIKEMSSLQNIGVKSILPLQGVHFDTKQLTLYIFMPKECSLFNMLHRNTEYRISTSKMKKDLALSIARAIKSIHDRPRDRLRDSEQRFYAHKHLSSHNILISGSLLHHDYKVYLTDMESEQLRKYARLFMDYNHTNAWSPPELLHNDKHMNDIGANSSMMSDKGYDQRSIDVFSFGIILWEIETQQVPFEGMNDSEIKNVICDQNLRPQIPRGCNSNLAYLIRCCWQTRPEKRSNFEYICNFMEKVEFNCN